MPATSPSRSADIAVVGLSARALCTSARRAGLRPLAFDLFADADTRELSVDALRIGRTRDFGFKPRALMTALGRHVAPGVPLVLGAGFEGRPDLVRRMEARWEVIGNGSELLRRLRDPFGFARLLDALAIPHPAVHRANPGGAFLVKRMGGSGGGHVRENGAAAAGHYFQARIEGCAVSLLFLSDRSRFEAIGFSDQWTAPTRRSPFRYGGATGPVELPAELAADIRSALGRLVAATGLKGLGSADLILTKSGGWSLIEINPRPGATLDLFDGEGVPLIRRHIEACAGLLREETVSRPARAAAVLYASRRLRAPGWDWPDWAADRPNPGTPIAAGAPFCTVLAREETTLAARAVLERRMIELRHRFGFDAGSASAAAAA